MATAAPTKRQIDVAVEADIPHIVNIWFDAFGDALKPVFPDTESGRRWVYDGFKKCMGPRYEGGPESTTLVSRDADGIPVALAHYHRVDAGNDPAKSVWNARWQPTDEYQDMSNEVLHEFFEPKDRCREFLMGDRAHVFLEVLGTMRSHQKQGHGKVLVEWGNALADELGLECYLDASAAGKHLYEAMGYAWRDVSQVTTSPRAYSMVRPAKTQGSGST